VSRSPVRVVAVSNDVLRPKLVHRLLEDGDYDVIVFESMARAYSRIRQLQPDVIVLFMEIDDVDGCQLLSMLEIDRSLSDVRVLACAACPDPAATQPLPAFDNPCGNLVAAAS
jgi:CheY-like chemotaxis protein